MLVSVLKKLVRSLAVLLVVSFSTFVLMYGNGPGIARAVLGTNATPADVKAETARLGLDDSLLVQYGRWIKGVVTGNLGDSFFTGQSVSSALSSRVPVTLTLIVLSILLTVVVSVLVGVTAAVRGGWVDRVVQFLAVLGAAVPPFIIAIGLVFALAVSVRVFPATGYVSPDQSLKGWVESVTLPVVALLVGSIANAASQFRGAVLDTLSQDFVRTLRARGIPESRVIFRHVLRSAAGPGLTALSLQTVGLIGGAVIIEQVFALPGLGDLSNTSAQKGDVPVVMGCVLVTIVIVLVVNVLGDLAAAALNPKARKR
ncbi:ABC transporter permease [Streptomyces sp. NPDC101234]|uniref:ABC transporter permease n=1 Tax=Streptomyces sp. NPDC101234 TaxID=3366138 RepID=UPI0037F32947